MKNKYLYMSWLVTIILLASCSSQSTKDDASLTTSISKDGSKRFIYSIDLRQREVKFNDLQRGKPTRQRGLLPASIGRIEKNLKRKLKSVKFCETGYFIYDRRYRNGNFEIYGECNEASQTKPKV